MGGQQRVRGDVKCELGRKVFRAEGFEWGINLVFRVWRFQIPFLSLNSFPSKLFEPFFWSTLNLL